MSRIYISAIHKSSGKTTLTVGLAAALAQRGAEIQPFKRGPDYIDPGWLSLAAGRSCHNLDFHTQSEAELLAAVANVATPTVAPSTVGTRPCQATEAGSAADFRGLPITLIEGNKGLHDGTDAHGRDSNAALAALLQAPVVLLVDCRGMTRGIAPTLLGHAQFDPRIKVSGVIFNRVAGSRHERKLRQAVEHYTDLAVLGALPEQAEISIQAPYLGLLPAAEQHAAQQTLRSIATATAEHVDLAAVMRIGASAPELPAATKSRGFAGGGATPPTTGKVAGNRANQVVCPRPPHNPSNRLGVAYDRAFNFYYPADLQALQAAGAELIWIDMLAAQQLPERLDGLFIGGGFPERHAAQLAANSSMRRSIQAAALAGLPIYAECGGLIYLCRNLDTGQGIYPMAGVFPIDLQMHPQPQGHGYVRLQITAAAPWSAAPRGTTELPAHEFHYSRITTPQLTPEELGIPCAYRIRGGSGLGNGYDGLVVANTLASYVHLRHTAACPWVDGFMAFVTMTSRHL